MSTERARPEPTPAFVEAVRAAREQAGLSPEEAAERVGIEASAYAAVERAERRIDLELIAQIARALDLSVAELFERAGL